MARNPAIGVGGAKTAPPPPKFPPYKIVRVDSLIPYAGNARLHSMAQIDQIASSIRQFGFTNPVLIEPGGGIIAGHGRVMAAQRLDMAELPVIELAGLSVSQKRALVIADNRLALNASWDPDLLVAELGELRSVDFDLGLTGFSHVEFESLLGTLVDAGGEWAGMPEYDQPDAAAYRRLIVHFRDQQAVDDFARVIGQKIGERTRFVWFPEIEREAVANKRYATNEP